MANFTVPLQLDAKLSVFVLLLLKSELDSDLKNRDIILERLHQFFILDFCINGISDEFIYLYLFINKRFISRWRKNTTHEDMNVKKIPGAVKKDFFRINKVMQYYIDVYPDKLFKPRSNDDKLMILSGYLRENYMSLSSDVRLYYRDKELLRSKLQELHKMK